MQDDEMGRIKRGVLAAVLAILLVVAIPVGPRAHAAPSWVNPCNLPGGSTVCDKVKDGTKLIYDIACACSLAGSVGEAINFATDPLGYMEQKLRSGAKSMFGAFGEELTGKNPNKPKKDTGKAEKGD
ncbi:hypothetical protein [Streptomyces sp. NPDC059783]|uniref:hypothetical protein n=1 Tax=Streptomyces sp. NPDC059783 TaxID=3346944 RepID=UPI00364E8DA2